MAGLDALFKPFGSAVFRHDLFSRETGTEPPRLVYPDIFIRLFQDDALLKSTSGLNRTIVLNKYDTSRPRHLAAVLWSIGPDGIERPDHRGQARGLVSNGSGKGD